MNTSYFSWTFLPKHVEDASLLDRGTRTVLTFRSFLSYHIGCAKAHMQAVMRQRCEFYCKAVTSSERKASSAQAWYRMGTIGTREMYTRDPGPEEDRH